MPGRIGEYQEWLRSAFDAPRTNAQIIVTLVSMSAVIGSIFHIAFVSQYPALVSGYETTVGAVEWGFTIFFTIEIALRIFAKPRPRQYLLTTFGIIDILAVLPTWLSLFFPGLPNLNWLRALRLIRLLRVVSVLRHSESPIVRNVGLLLQLAPFMAYAFILKTIIVVLEGADLWPHIPGLDLVISVIGFAIGVLLSTRLGTVQARMYDFEVGVADLVAAIRVIRNKLSDPALADRFAQTVERYCHGQCDSSEPREALEELATHGEGSIPPPIWINFHQTAQFVIERLSATGTSEYTRMLRNVVIIYIVAVLLVIPGLTGLLSAALVVYVLGGMFTLIMNMEKPYSAGQASLINADLEPLLRLNRGITGDMTARRASAV